MHLALMLMLFADRFWELKEPRAWTDEQLLIMLTDSPWAQTTRLRDAVPLPVYLATAKPLRLAEAEMERRYKAQARPQAQQPADDTAKLEYQAFLRENEGKVIILAIRNPNLKALAQAEESRMMEEESYMKAGKKKIRMTGHLPPGETDPVLRLVFPRPETFGKDLTFELYVPGVTGPYRQVSFPVKDLTYEGKLEL
jgi:hypothetical protein